MPARVEIVRLTPELLKRASEVLSSAFFDYPMFTFYFPDTKRRSRELPWYLKNVLRCALRYGRVYTTPEVSGVVFTLPPGHTHITLPEYIRNGFLLSPYRLGLRNYLRSMACEHFVDNTHNDIMEDRPHYYLWGLAVSPEYQGAGIGSALMRPILEKADTERVPLYLETHCEKNTAYYRRYGFSLARITRITKFDLPLWCMVREPDGLLTQV